MKKRLLILSSSILIFSGCLTFYCMNHKQPDIPVAQFEENTIEMQTETIEDEYLVENWNAIQPETSISVEPEPEFEEYDIHLMAIGDNLMHMGIVNTGRQNDGTYNYDFLFENIADFLDVSDIKIINQETPLAGNHLGFSGYPLFNSPTEVGDAIANAGFNVVLSATNHSADQGIDGMDHIVSYWKSHPEVLVVGLHEPIDEANTTTNPRIGLLEVKDVTFAVLNYTYGPNYGSVPTSVSSRMDILCATQPNSIALDYTKINPQVLDDIKEAKMLADFVIVCPHWGTEYALSPSSYQESFAIQMTEAGADVIIGTHPHVPQPITTITTENGNTSLCYYSLGNYVSTQQNGPSMLEEMAWVSFHVTEDGPSLNIEKSGVVPLVCQYRSGPLRLDNVYLLEDYTEELASVHGIRNWGGIPFHLSDLQKWSSEIIGDWALSKESILPNSAKE